MRVSFHPDHFTVIGTPRANVLRQSVQTLDNHVRMLEAMGLDEAARLNIHIGGTYQDRARTLENLQAVCRYGRAHSPHNHAGER